MDPILLEKIQESSTWYNLSSLRLADLKLFITATYLKSLQKAALFHHLSQSACSTAILRVEKALNIKLCHHGKRVFSLTKKAEYLLPFLEKWLNEIHNIVNEKKNLPIKIATTHSIAQIIAPLLIEEENIEFTIMRPNRAYEKVLLDDCSMAIVLDNYPWKKVNTIEIKRGYFQLYSRLENSLNAEIILPESQEEVLFLKQSFLENYKKQMQVKATIPSWVLIADILKNSDHVGFLPDFLAKKYDLHPVDSKIEKYEYKILALFKNLDDFFQIRFNNVIEKLTQAFN
jgi:DNA-binding transcriptional LysR family regulator